MAECVDTVRRSIQTLTYNRKRYQNLHTILKKVGMNHSNDHHDHRDPYSLNVEVEAL